MWHTDGMFSSTVIEPLDERYAKGKISDEESLKMKGELEK